MGVYDIINVPCPSCGASYPAQSKSGECEMKEYELAQAPQDVLADVNRHAPFECDCGAIFEVRDGIPTPCEPRERKDYLGISSLKVQ